MLSRRRKVCLATNTSWYALNFRAHIISTLIEQGHEVVVIAPRDRFSDKLVDLGARHVHLELDNRGTNPVRDAATFLRLCRLLRRERPDVLLTFTPKINIYGSLAARVMRLPVVANVSGLGSGFLRGGWLARLMVLLYRASLRGAQHVFFENNDDLELFVRDGLVERSRTDRLPGSGVDLERFRPSSMRGNPRPFTFLVAARLLWDKGLGEYVEAARRLRTEDQSLQFLIVGEAGAQNITAVPAEEIARWAKEGVVTYLGPSEDMAREYVRADCVVLPSYREGTSRVLLEAASMALPIITTDVPGCRDVVEDGVNGYLCRPRDAADLAEKMRRMMNLTEQRRDEMGHAGRELVLAHFDERLVTGHYLKQIAAATNGSWHWAAETRHMKRRDVEKIAALSRARVEATEEV